ncbi:MmpS family transport accessory protein [Actinoplanes awajinensis]|uniref:Uncharacterized protein n=1 Tax=Actinoplanes awajinensis subsp. mycoplanecinus TaxID=135947 RepID=A0A0X3VCE6_9ACTN|nr:MmpS family transport accessory protein [Actinoplanes awajinensis]KUL42097.1 hypothetical protein ADL15_02020 [Actinoplanes awajinensis subsp. mycoplanecinus]
MIDLDSPFDAVPAPRRPRRRIYLAVGAAALVLAGAATAFAVTRPRADPPGVRFEAESASGKALTISWDVGVKHVGRTKEVSTPWSTTVTGTPAELDAVKSMVVLSTADDEVTCRIIIDGAVVAEFTQPRVAACVHGMEKLPDFGDLPDPALPGSGSDLGETPDPTLPAG